MPKTSRELIEAGYTAEKKGLPCEAPTARERDRAAWEQGWRSARHERQESEAAHLEMMRDANRWPVWPLLPVQHVSRKEPDGCGMNLLGFMCEAGMTGQAAPKVYVGSMYFRTEGKRLEELPVEDYPNLEAVIAAGWRVN